MRAWALRERAIEENSRSADGVALGPSTMRWKGDSLVIDVRERQSPWGQPLRGRVVLRSQGHLVQPYVLDRAGRHRWWPIAPSARIEVDLEAPALSFRGRGYHDANAGDEPLEASLTRWTWSRAHGGSGRALLAYEVTDAEGASLRYAIDVPPFAEPRDLGNLGSFVLPKSRWGIDRRIHADSGAEARVDTELEDTPFYARALVRTRMGGEPVLAMHEELSVDRLRRAWVRSLLRFRMNKDG